MLKANLTLKIVDDEIAVENIIRNTHILLPVQYKKPNSNVIQYLCNSSTFSMKKSENFG